MAYIGKQPTKAPLTASDIEDGIITAAKIEDGAVVAAEIASNAVTTAKINADAVTNAKIADDAIDSEHYTDGSIDTAHIADSQVTTAKIADTAITTAKITDANVTTAKIAADAITEAKIADGAVESEHLNANIISGQTELAATPADTDEFLISDAGVLKRLDYSHIKSSPALELVTAGNSGSDFSIQNCFTSDYNIYYVHLYHGRPAVASSGSGVHMRYLGASNTEITDSYYWSFNRAYVQSSSNGTSAHVGWGGTFFDLAQNGSSATASRSWTGTLIFYHPSNSTYHTNFTYQGTYFAYNNSEFESVSGGGQNINTNYKVTTGLKFFQGSSTISEMYYAVYGLKVS
jgi:hypothetical protein